MTNAETQRQTNRMEQDMHAPLNAEGAEQSPTRCPWCGSDETEPMALFGAHLLVEQYYCRACHTPFERIAEGKR